MSKENFTISASMFNHEIALRNIPGADVADLRSKKSSLIVRILFAFLLDAATIFGANLLPTLF